MCFVHKTLSFQNDCSEFFISESSMLDIISVSSLSLIRRSKDVCTEDVSDQLLLTSVRLLSEI